jgi:hypothetical protein
MKGRLGRKLGEGGLGVVAWWAECCMFLLELLWNQGGLFRVLLLGRRYSNFFAWKYSMKVIIRWVVLHLMVGTFGIFFAKL